MEKKNWLHFDSFETEESDRMEKALQCKTLDETIALNSIDPCTVNISKPSTLSPMMGIDNAIISEFEPVCRIFDMMKENGADGHMQNTPHQNVTKRRVDQNRTANSIVINTLIAYREVSDEINK